MKKLLLFMLAALLTTGLVACDETTSGTEEKDGGDSTEAKKGDEELTIGDTAEIDGIKFTLKNVTTTDDRNQFADTNPTMVVKIEYEVENNTDDSIAVGGDLELYDGTGNKMDLYPLENTMGSLQPGKKMQGTEHFGIEKGPIEIYFEPLFSFADPAIFTADIQ